MAEPEPVAPQPPPADVEVFTLGEPINRWECSACGTVVDARGERPPCPSCGADYRPRETGETVTVTGITKPSGKRSPARLYREDVEEMT